MTNYLGKSCSFCLPRVPFVNCRQFMYLVISLLVLRAGYGIWLYQFLIIAYLFTLYREYYLVGSRVQQKEWILRIKKMNWTRKWKFFNGSTVGFLLLQWCCSARRGSPGVGRSTFLSSPHLCFIIVFICDLFVSRGDFVFFTAFSCFNATYPVFLRLVIWVYNVCPGLPVEMLNISLKTDQADGLINTPTPLSPPPHATLAHPLPHNAATLGRNLTAYGDRCFCCRNNSFPLRVTDLFAYQVNSNGKNDNLI